MRLIGLVLALGLTLAPIVAGAQSVGRVYQLGILTLGPAGQHPAPWWQPFLAELRELNYVEGRNLVLTYRGADGKPDRLPGLAADLMKAKVELIVTTGPRETLAAKRATSSIPIVFTVVHDQREARDRRGGQAMTRIVKEKKALLFKTGKRVARRSEGLSRQS